MSKLIYLLNEIRKTDVSMAGGKGANLGEMVHAGIPVPDGAVLCAAAYDLFIESNRIDVKQILSGASSEKEASEKSHSELPMPKRLMYMKSLKPKVSAPAGPITVLSQPQSR